MHTSQIVQIDGVFVGTAVTLPFSNGLRFVAVDPRVDELDGSIWPTMKDIEQLTRQLFLTGRLPQPRYP